MDRRKFIQQSSWIFMGLAASGSILNAVANDQKEIRRRFKLKPSELNVYWGDIHNHCNLTYGHGDMRSAFEAAVHQLDFVSVTPHAMWPDIPGRDDPRLAWVIDYHTSAFKRLRAGKWDAYVAMTKEYNQRDNFLTFLSYECHSMADGDHVVLDYDLDAPLLDCTSIDDLKRQLEGKKAYITPHHMGYQVGYRGYNWKSFQQNGQTPFVEIFSRHGLCESDQDDYPYLHDMGPRVFDGSALHGLELGHKFGMIASTDQHAGYPGSYGDGRIAVLAKSLTRDHIWDAMAQRHVYAVTGDKILIDFRINDHVMGETLKANTRNIYLHVEGQNTIDYVDVIKNGQCIARMKGPYHTEIPKGESVRAKIKIEFGWNRVDTPVRWDGFLKLSAGKLNRVTSCFRGSPSTGPVQNEQTDYTTYVNKILSVTDSRVDLEMYSRKNQNTLTPGMQGVVLDVSMPLDATVEAHFNGKEFLHSLGDLFEGTKAHFMIGWLSEAIQFNRAAPEENFLIEHVMTDKKPQRDTDYYYVRVRQRDGQWAWSSPIWVDRV